MSCVNEQNTYGQQLEADKDLCNFLMVCPQSSSKIFLTVTLSLPKRAGPLNLVEKLTIRLYWFLGTLDKVCDCNLGHRKMLYIG